MEPIQPIPESQSSDSQTPTMSLAGRLLNVFVAPGDVFDGIKTAPYRAANWLMPAILFIVLSWLSTLLIFSQASVQQKINDASNRAIDQLVEKGKISSAQAEQARTGAEKSGSVTYKILGVVDPVLTAVITPFWGGLILWLVGSFALKGHFPYLKAVEVAGLANMILVLDVIVRTLLIIITGNLFASLSLTLALKECNPQKTLYALCALVNMMLFWMLVVRSIGLARLTGASVGKAAAWTFGIWIALRGMMIAFNAAMNAVTNAVFGG